MDLHEWKTGIYNVTETLFCKWDVWIKTTVMFWVFELMNSLVSCTLNDPNKKWMRFEVYDIDKC